MKNFTLNEGGLEAVGWKLTDSRMRIKMAAITNVTDSAQGLRSVKSRSQNMTHRPNNIDNTPA